MFFEFQIPFLVRDVYNKVFPTTPKWSLANDTVIATDRASVHLYIRAQQVCGDITLSNVDILSVQFSSVQFVTLLKQNVLRGCRLA